MSFVQNVMDYELLAPLMARSFAIVIVLLETVLAVGFIVGYHPDWLLVLAFAVLAMFLAGGILTLKRGKKVLCGCLGNSNEWISRRSLARLLILLSGVVYLIALRFVGNLHWPGLGALYSAGWANLIATIVVAIWLMVVASWVLSIGELGFMIPKTLRRRIS